MFPLAKMSRWSGAIEFYQGHFRCYTVSFMISGPSILSRSAAIHVLRYALNREPETASLRTEIATDCGLDETTRQDSTADFSVKPHCQIQLSESGNHEPQRSCR